MFTIIYSAIHGTFQLIAHIAHLGTGCQIAHIAHKALQLYLSWPHSFSYNCYFIIWPLPIFFHLAIIAHMAFTGAPVTCLIAHNAHFQQSLRGSSCLSYLLTYLLATSVYLFSSV